MTNRKNDPQTIVVNILSQKSDTNLTTHEEQTHMMYMSCIKESVSTEIPSGTVGLFKQIETRVNSNF